MEQRDRFMLEEKIMQCWNITDDLDTIAEYIADADDIPTRHQDQLLNMLFGMKSLYNQKFTSTFNLFTELVHNKTIR